MSRNEDKELCFKLAGALILSRKYRSKGAPLSKVREIFRKFGIDLDIGLNELKKRFESIGLKLVIISEKKEKEFQRVFAVIDPMLNLEEAKPYSRDVLTVLAFIYNLEEDGQVSILKLTDALKGVLKEEKSIKDILTRAISRLKHDNIIKVEKGVIILTPIGKAMKPPPDVLDRILIETLVKGAKK